jgi:putative sterol carrier protein
VYFHSKSGYYERMNLEEATEKVRQKMARAGHIKAKVKFDFGDDGVVFVDSTQDPPEISHEDKDADASLILSLDTFAKFLSGGMDPTIAFMMGKLKVKGSMGLAMKLNAVLED